MKNLANTYGKFNIEKAPQHIYPTEWIIRTLMGNYPNLKLKKNYKKKKILDVGFGDCRNMPLLANLEFDIYGVEITKEVVEKAQKRLGNLNIKACLKKGANAKLPFNDNYFDFILSSFSMYYIDEKTTFDDNVREYLRVLKPNGCLIATLAESKTFIFKDCIPLENSHVKITNDIFGLRNDYVLKYFSSPEEVKSCFTPFFKNISIGYSYNDYYGLPISYFMIVCNKK